MESGCGAVSRAREEPGNILNLFAINKVPKSRLHLYYCTDRTRHLKIFTCCSPVFLLLTI